MLVILQKGYLRIMDPARNSARLNLPLENMA